MVILVRCPDKNVTVALASQLDRLVGDGLITEYLGPDGWVAATRKRRSVKVDRPLAGTTRWYPAGPLPATGTSHAADCPARLAPAPCPCNAI